MAMTDDRLRILRMVEQGQISAEEGARLLDAITDDAARIRSTSSRPRASSSLRREAYASATERSTRRNDGICQRSSGGKYVPAKNGTPSGVRKTVIGHPPLPVIACTAVI